MYGLSEGMFYDALNKWHLSNQIEKASYMFKWLCIPLMIILQEFPGDSYKAHTSCISENEKYGGKGWQAKPNANKVIIWFDNM